MRGVSLSAGKELTLHFTQNPGLERWTSWILPGMTDRPPARRRCQSVRHPGLDARVQEVERQLAVAQQVVVEGAQVEGRPELALGVGAQLADLQLSELVGRHGARAVDDAVHLVLDLVRAPCRVRGVIVDRLLARPSPVVDSGVDDEA